MSRLHRSFIVAAILLLGIVGTTLLLTSLIIFLNTSWRETLNAINPTALLENWSQFRLGCVMLITLVVVMWRMTNWRTVQ